jgi:hypothetical protein
MTPEDGADAPWPTLSSSFADGVGDGIFEREPASS